MAKTKQNSEKAAISTAKVNRSAELRDLTELTTQFARQQNGLDSLFAEQINDLRKQIEYQAKLTIQLDHESMSRLQSLAELSMQVVQINRTLDQLAQRISDLAQTSLGKQGDA
jgi:tRNA uridine 5-carbamoylmethylation protein Kti12